MTDPSPHVPSSCCCLTVQSFHLLCLCRWRVHRSLMERTNDQLQLLLIWTMCAALISLSKQKHAYTSSDLVSTIVFLQVSTWKREGLDQLSLVWNPNINITWISDIFAGISHNSTVLCGLHEAVVVGTGCCDVGFYFAEGATARYFSVGEVPFLMWVITAKSGEGLFGGFQWYGAATVGTYPLPRSFCNDDLREYLLVDGQACIGVDISVQSWKPLAEVWFFSPSSYYFLTSWQMATAIHYYHQPVWSICFFSQWIQPGTTL